MSLLKANNLYTDFLPIKNTLYCFGIKFNTKDVIANFLRVENWNGFRIKVIDL
jgi:hypothetical protein